ncbi:hypothetical protein PtB15_3B286 [Puccinia triticina]|nr:hypothetical protein PtB15_3B286 [Puccinia triticina]
MPTHLQPSTSRRGRTPPARRNSYTPHPSLHDEEQVAHFDLPETSNRSHLRASKKGKQRAEPQDEASTSFSREHHAARSYHAARSSPDYDGPVSHSSFQLSQPPHSDAYSPAAPRTKRKQDDISPSPESRRKKPRGAPALGRVPTNAQVLRQRQGQHRVRRKSLVIRPSFHDEDVFVPNPHPSVRGVVGWRNSLPQGMSPPPFSQPCHNHIPDHDFPTTGPVAGPSQSRTGPVAGCSCVGVGPDVLSEFTRVTGRLADQLEANNNSMVSTRPTISKPIIPPSGQKDLTLLSRVRLHVKTLFGKTMALNQFPPPATEREKANWKRDPENDFPDDESVSHSSNYSGDDGGDPGFPYPNGPGHRKASATTLKIMWRSMFRCGVISFRPDLSRGPHDADNLFLWDLAHSIFIKLVKAQEYPDIDLENCSEQKIHQTIMNHAKQLHRTYCEAGWDPQRLDKRAVGKRRQARTKRLRDTRIAFLAQRAQLVPLIPVIDACTSDAETEPDLPGGSNEREKRVLVSHLPWRHHRITKAVNTIDEIIESKRKSGCRDFGNTSHQRIRPPHPQISNRSPPSCLSTDVFDNGWVMSQRLPVLNALKMDARSLTGALNALNKMK